MTSERLPKQYCLSLLLALVALYVFGGEVIQGFVEALIFGVALGTYSSVYVASPLLMLFKIRDDGAGKTQDGETAEA